MSRHRRLRVRIKRSRKPYRHSSKMKTRHHNRAKSLGGSYDKSNIFMLNADKHRAYHLLFGLRTFKEAADVLLRLDAMHKKIVSSQGTA